MRSRSSIFIRGSSLAGLFVLGVASPAQAQSVEELARLSIEELANVEVTSASKRAESLSEAPAAIFVIDGEDIRRSAATSLPEALRLAPNLHVQRIDARQYSISARGFAGYETSNKLLALIDGRSIYSSIASGVVWDLRNPLLEDVARIEVVSGPGGTLYGSNAFSGVINILSKSAFDTLGGLARAEGGAVERTAALRYGGVLGGAGAYRVYVNGYDRDGFPDGAITGSADGGAGARAGFRSDFSSGANEFTLQGDLFFQDNDNDGEDSGHNVTLRWTRGLGEGASVQLQAYYDMFERDLPEVFLERERTVDVALQGNFERGAHAIVAGAGIRAVRNRFANLANPLRLDPEVRTLWIGNAFAQDRIALGETLALTVGLKLERTTYTDWQLLPNLRLAWRPDERTLFWAAGSRAIRTPSRIDRDLVLPPLLLADNFRSEYVTALEAGYRGQPSDSTSVSVSFFYNLYDRLRSTSFDPVNIFPLMLGNGLKGDGYGVEVWGTAQVAPWWRLSAGASALEESFELKPGENDLENGISLGNDPGFQAQLRSRMTFDPGIELDVAMRAVDDLPDPAVDGYVDIDARVGWQARPGLELYVSGINLLDGRRDESADTDRGQLVKRSVIAGARIDF